jgi:hypothetical protein
LGPIGHVEEVSKQIGVVPTVEQGMLERYSYIISFSWPLKSPMTPDDNHFNIA